MANAFTQFFTGTPSQVNQVPTVSPDQLKILQYLMQQGQQQLQNPYQGFEPIAEQARSQFGRYTAPSLAERFTAMGGGALNSSGYQQAQERAKTDLELGLAAQQAQYGMQNRNQALQQLSQGLIPQFQNIVSPGQPGLLQEFLPSLGRAGASAIGGLASGGPVGGAIGGIGSLIASLFGGGNRQQPQPYSAQQAQYQSNPNSSIWDILGQQGGQFGQGGLPQGGQSGFYNQTFNRLGQY